MAEPNLPEVFADIFERADRIGGAKVSKLACAWG
mgnify:CR=1 FL=1